MVIQVVSSHFVKIPIRNIELLIDKYLLSSVPLSTWSCIKSCIVNALELSWFEF